MSVTPEQIERAELRMYDAMRERDSLRIRLEAQEAAAREVVQTAEGLIDENKRLSAEVTALADELHTYMYECTGLTHVRTREAVEEIKIKARNNIEEK